MRWRHPLHVGDVRPVETVPTPGFPTPRSTRVELHSIIVAKAVNQIIADSDLPRRVAPGTQAVVQAAPPRGAPALRFPSHLKLPRSSPRACGVAVAVAVAVARLPAPAPHAAVAYRSRPSHSSVLSRLTSSEHSLLSTAPTASPGARTYEW